MDGPQSDEIPDAMLRNLRIVVGVLAAGVFIFASFVIVAHPPGPAPGFNGVPVVSFIAAGFAVIMLVARTVIVPRIATARRRILPNNPAVTIQQLMTMFATRTIVGAALIEGAAFFLLVAYLAEGQPWTWVGGMVMGVLLAALQAPTRARAEAAFAADRQAIEDQRAAL